MTARNFLEGENDIDSNHSIAPYLYYLAINDLKFCRKIKYGLKISFTKDES